MPKYSIITCVSNDKIYTECLLSSINKVRCDHDIEIIPVVNNDNRYSASNALNIGIDAAKSDIIIFSHQDVILRENWFSMLDEAISSLDDWAVIGAAGIDRKYSICDIGKWGGSVGERTVAVGTVYDDIHSEHPYWDGDKRTSLVHCVDECLFAMNRKTGLRFDTCYTGFHFYGVDLCLQARSAGYGVYASHLPITHIGKYSASLLGDKKYWVYYRYLHQKWHQRFPVLLGTHMHWNNKEMVSYINMTIGDKMGTKIDIKSMGLIDLRLETDRN